MATISSGYTGDTLVNGTNDIDSITSYRINVTILGYGGNDYIENRGYNITIDGGSGDDEIYSDVFVSYGSENFQNATIYGDTGNDTIQLGNGNNSIHFSAGDGNDTVSSSSGGNDTLIFDGVTITNEYLSFNGTDLIVNYGEGDSVNIQNFAIMNADIGHIAPKMTLINGSYAHVSFANGKGTIDQFLK